ncbi:hypothetical protein HGA64_04120 [Candidatus Falkowbacteria bacterium]|nr:hypothetical protein [Candidatus Falkowbacteria bacterium]
MTEEEKIEQTQPDLIDKELEILVSTGQFESQGSNIEYKVLISAEIEKLKSAIEKSHKLGEFLKGRDWEALALIRRFDSKTLYHSLNTYSILRNKIHEIVLPDGRLLIDYINEQEEFTEHELYRAAVLHDVGKIKIPSLIINNVISRDRWKAKFKQQSFEEQKRQLRRLAEIDGLDIPEHVYATQESLEAFIEEKKISPTLLVPIANGLFPDEIESIREQGYDPDLPLGILVRCHEQYSAEIIRQLSDENDSSNNRVAELASHHHNYGRDKTFAEQNPASTTSLAISENFAEFLPQIIALADIQEAMESSLRNYRKGPAKQIEKFNEIIMRADTGINPFFTAVWLKPELDFLEKQHTVVSPDEAKALKKIYAWVEDQLNKKPPK